MASPAEALRLVSERMAELRRVFSELEHSKFTFGLNGPVWTDIEDHFREIEACLQNSYDVYTVREKEFEEKMKSVQVQLQKRDSELSAKERDSVSRLQHEKDVAAAAILEQKRKLAGEKRKIDEHVSRVKPNAIDSKESGPLQGSTKTSSAPQHSMDPTAGNESNAKPNINDDTSEGSKSSEKLNSFCQNMDFGGLKKYMVEIKRDVKNFAASFTAALKLCKDPPLFVLDTLQHYFETENHGKEFGKDDCFAWSVLLDALVEVQVKDPPISDSVKAQARKFADKWRETLKLDGQISFKMVLDGGNFLKFVAVYRLAPSYDQDELCDILVKVARRKQKPKLIHLLGMTDKAPDIVEKLIKDGKPIQAVTFACSFGLLERFSPAPLLKAHIKEAKNVAKTILKTGNNSQTAQKEAVQKELAALKDVANVVKEYKLEAHYTLDYVEKQVAQLEKSKADRKQVAGVSKQQNPVKRHRSGVSGVHSPIVGGPNIGVSPNRPRYPMSDRYDMGHLGRAAVEQRSMGMFVPPYGGVTPNPSAFAGPYAFTPRGLAPPLGYQSSIHRAPSGSVMDYSYASDFSSLRGYKPYL